MLHDEILTADFPGAVRGYSKVAVDDFVRQVGQRLQAMQALLDEKCEVAEARADALEKAMGDLAGYADKEAAITKAYVSIEQRRVDVDQELIQLRAAANAEIDARMDAAQAEAEGILSAASKRAEEMQALAEAACALQLERLNTLRAEYDATVADIRRSLEAHLKLLPIPGDSGASTPDVALTSQMEMPWSVASEAAA